MGKDGKNTGRVKKDRVGRGLYWLYVIFLLLSVALIARLVSIQVGYHPDEKVVQALTPTPLKHIIEPARGAILSDDGRMLAISIPIYDIHMDCTVMKESFANIAKKNQPRADSLEDAWMGKARALSEGLASILGEKSADEYFNAIRQGRQQNKRYLKICTGIERKEFNQIIQLPLFCESTYYGGMIVEKENIRKYPYGTLARRTIGFVRNNKSMVDNTHIGIEGKYDFVLHGKDGVEYMRIIDNKKRVQDSDSAYVKAEDGNDVRTTINIDMQDIADKALREQLEGQAEIEGGCLVLMEVSTGAIKAMVNLTRDSVSTRLEEVQNFAVGRRIEPGSVFKTVTLLSVLSDGYIKSLDETIPTNHGVVRNAKLRQDVHILDWEREHNTKEISIIDGFKISSNYVFASLAVDNYGSHPKQFIDNIYMYKLGETFDFDLGGLRQPYIPSPSQEGWSNATLGLLGFGYSSEETPLHILTFYNAIAGKGRMMKPYLVESVEKYGSTIEKMGPTVLNASICTKAVADTITRALCAVTEEGTARRLKNAKCAVAGKTGTSFGVVSPGTPEPYKDKYGRQQYNGTFVGFFPAENPKYSIICAVYSHLTHNSFQGGGLPAMAVRTVVDQLYAMDSSWGESLPKSGQLPQMRVEPTVKAPDGTVPDVKGKGLRYALYDIEDAGYKCEYSGIGHVSSQHPAPGTKAAKGTTVKITLK